MANLAIVSAGKRLGPFRGKDIACIHVNSACRGHSDYQLAKLNRQDGGVSNDLIARMLATRV